MTTLLADIGGTHARFAWADGVGGHAPPLVLKVADFPRMADAVLHALARLGPAPEARQGCTPPAGAGPNNPAGAGPNNPAGAGPTKSTGAGLAFPAPARAIFALAGPVVQGRCVLTNSPWGETRADDLVIACGIAHVRLLNDLEAQAWLLPTLGADQTLHLGGGPGNPAAPMLLITPGTGLGVALHIPGVGAVPTEGGHATLAGASAEEDAVLAKLRARFGHASAERALAGTGFAHLREAGLSPEAATTMHLALLAGFAGSLALATGAQGGVFLGGSILNERSARLLEPGFHERFLAKGRFCDWLAAVPLRLIRMAEPGLAGLARLAVTGRQCAHGADAAQPTIPPNYCRNPSASADASKATAPDAPAPSPR